MWWGEPSPMGTPRISKLDCSPKNPIFHSVVGRMRHAGTNLHCCLAKEKKSTRDSLKGSGSCGCSLVLASSLFQHPQGQTTIAHSGVIHAGSMNMLGPVPPHPCHPTPAFLLYSISVLDLEGRNSCSLVGFVNKQNPCFCRLLACMQSLHICRSLLPLRLKTTANGGQAWEAPQSTFIKSACIPVVPASDWNTWEHEVPVPSWASRQFCHNFMPFNFFWRISPSTCW